MKNKERITKFNADVSDLKCNEQFTKLLLDRVTNAMERVQDLVVRSQPKKKE